MAGEPMSGRRPVGKITAIIPPTKSGAPDRFIQVGVVWPTKSGKFICYLDVEPVCWKDPFVQRTLLIELNEDARRSQPLDEDDPEPLPEGADVPF